MRKFHLFGVLLCMAMQTYGQNKRNTLPQITPKSPDAAIMETYGDIPVSESSGTADIKIPLHTISIGSFDLDLGLTYHKNGLKVDEVPSSVGDGWALYYGGMISFQQRGINDFKPGGLFDGGITSGAMTSLKQFFRGQMTADQKWLYLEQVIGGTIDSEFDQYNYNFFGYSGSYYYDTLMNAITLPKKDLRIIRQANEIRVIDNDNNSYYFGTVENSSIVSNSDVELRPNFNDVSAYYLSRVITNQGRTISYKYKTYSYYVTRSHSSINFMQSPPAPDCATGLGISYNDELVTTSILLPDSILFDNGYVKFSISTAVREDLKTIQPNAAIPSVNGFTVYNSNAEKIKEFSFPQGYFGTNKRLKLSGINEMNGTKVDKMWKFTYYNEESSPTIYSMDKDHWGYYNGAGNSSLIPNIDYSEIIPQWITMSQTSANRNSSTASQMNMLQKIQYPTGGTDVIEYEPNQIKVRAYDQITSLSPFFNPDDATYFDPLASASTTLVGAVSGSFVIPAPPAGATATTVQIQGSVTLDPSHFDDPTFSFTGPTGADLTDLYKAMNTLIPGYPNQTGTTLISKKLIPGTYTYSFIPGQDFNGGTNMTYNINFNIAVEKQKTPIPYLIGGVRIKRVIKSDSTGTPSNYRTYVYTDSLSSVAFKNIPNYVSSTNILATWVVATGCSTCGNRYTVYDENVIPFGGSHIEYGNVSMYDSSTLGILGRTDNTYLFTDNEYGSYASPYVAPVNTSWKAGSLTNQKIYKLVGSMYTLLEETKNDYLPFNRNKITTGHRTNYSTYCNLSSAISHSFNVSLSTLFSEQFGLVQTTKRSLLPVKGLINQTTITFGSVKHTQPTISAALNSKGELLKEKIIYSFDYDTTLTTNVDARAIRNIVRLNMMVPIERIQYRTIAGVDYVVGGTCTRYREDRPLVDRMYSLRLANPILMSSFVPSAISGIGEFSRDSRYITDAVFTSYDELGNITSVAPVDKDTTSYMYDYQKMYAVAEIENALSTDVSYTSFEADQKGNWTFAGVPVADASSPTGSKCYNTASGAITKTGLTSTKTYLLSYWTKNAAAYTITGTISGFPIKGRSVNGWTLYTHKITGVTSLTISGGYVDELRLYPADAMMKTFTYKPLMGTTSECDPNNSITYYYYDNTGRLLMVKDQDGKIVKMMDYQYQTSINQ